MYSEPAWHNLTPDKIQDHIHLFPISRPIALSDEVRRALQEYAVVNHPQYGKIYAFEVDGFGSAYLSDDANVPNLLSLPYLGGTERHDPIYENTRKFVWSKGNSFFFKGTVAEGIGGHQ